MCLQGSENGEGGHLGKGVAEIIKFIIHSSRPKYNIRLTLPHRVVEFYGVVGIIRDRFPIIS